MVLKMGELKVQTFYVIIKKNYLSIYEKNQKSYERVYLRANSEFAYSVNSAKDYIEKILNMIVEEYNLDTIGEIDLIVIYNEDDIVSDAILNALGENVKERIDIEKLMLKVSSSLERDKNLHIFEYGINYDDKQYLVKNENVVKNEFSLLSYTLTDDMLMKFVG